jgi:hypothetical protein
MQIVSTTADVDLNAGVLVVVRAGDHALPTERQPDSDTPEAEREGDSCG